MANIPIYYIPYDFLYSCLDEDKLKDIDNVYFLLKNGISSCQNTDNNSITSEIEKNEFFSILKQGEKSLYIENTIVGEIKRNLEFYISQYIRLDKNDSKKNSLFSNDYGLIKINEEGDVKFNLYNDINSIVNFLNNISIHKNASKLTKELFSGIDGNILNILIKKENKIDFLNFKINTHYKFREIDKIVKSIDNKKGLFPGGSYLADSRITLVSIKNKIEFNKEFENNRQKGSLESVTVSNKQNIVNKKRTVLINKIIGMKNEIKNHLSFFNELNNLINKNISFIYYGDVFKINDSEYNKLVKNYECENNRLKELLNIGKDEKYHIPAWDLAFKVNHTLSKIDEKIINNNIEILELEYNKLKVDIKDILDSIEKLKECRDGISVINKNFIKFYYKIKCINTKVNKVSSVNKLQIKVDSLLNHIDNKIENRNKGFLSLIYKTFLPKKHEALINDLVNQKIEINNIKNYLINSEEYLFNTISLTNDKGINKYRRVVDEGTLVSIAVSNISKVSFSKDIFDYFSNQNKKINNILTSIL